MGMSGVSVRWCSTSRAGCRATTAGSLYTVSRGETGPGGPTFLFSHGVTIDSRIWVKQFASLPEMGVRVVAFDHRGHGESLSGESGHSIDNLAADVRTVLEGLDLTDVVLVGHSMGGIAAQAFAIRHAEIARVRVRGLVLLSTFAAHAARCGVRPFSGTASRVAGWLDLAALTRRPELGTLVARLGFGRRPVASQVELVREMLASCSPETVRDAVVPLLGLDLVDDLDRIDRPTIVIAGTSDILTPPVESRRLARHIRGARLELIERAGHTIMLERSELFHELLLDFARDVGVAPIAAAASA